MEYCKVHVQCIKFPCMMVLGLFIHYSTTEIFTQLKNIGHARAQSIVSLARSDISALCSYLYLYNLDFGIQLAAFLGDPETKSHFSLQNKVT